MGESERQVKFYGKCLSITTSGRFDQSQCRIRTPTNENHMSIPRNMDFLHYLPKKKLYGFEPYIPPHRRCQTFDENNIVKFKQTIVNNPSIPRNCYSNLELTNSSLCTGTKSECSAFYYNKNFSHEPSSNENIDIKESHGLNDKFYDYKNNSSLVSISNDILTERVLKLIDFHLNTGLKEIFKSLYQQTYGETLPSDLLNSWTFSVVLKENTQSSVINRKVSDSSKQMELPMIKSVLLELNTLGNEFWVNIHYCKNVSEVWGVIMDENHLGKVVELATQMKSFYECSKTSNNRIIQNAYYAIKDKSWHRVKCLQCNDSTATVFFIDSGEKDDVALNKLHQLSSQFCILPAQAVKMVLTGLEIFTDFDELQLILNAELYNKIMYVKVTSVTVDYLSVQLYFTNDNNEMINVNELIMCQMLEKMLNPKLYIQRNNIVPAHVSHLKNRIYIQLDIPSFRYFNLLMEKAIKELNDNEHYVHQKVKYDINQIYFVKFNKDKRWYRGKIMKFIDDNEVKIFLIDVGSLNEVNKNNIISLEKVCNILANYPPQAIEVQLDQIPILDPKILSTLQKVISRNKIHVKFVTTADSNDISRVQLLKKTESNFFISINDALLFLNKEISSKHDDNELAKSNHSISTSSDKDFSTSLVQSLKSFKISNTEASKKELELKINKEKISRIRKIHNNQERGVCMAMCLSSVIEAPQVPQGYFDVHVFMSSDPSHFVVQLLRNKNLHFNKMIYKMSETCRVYQGPTLTYDSIKVGQLYACKSLENNNRDWCRAYVTEVRDKQTASVYCCDYGSYKNVDISNMVPLEHEYYRLPYQAIWAELNGVKPTSKEWTVMACLKFQELTQSKNFVSRVVSQRNFKSKSLENPVKTPITKEVIYSLELIDTSSSDEDIDIADLLVKYDIAERC
ncbi:tudor domain-containing protein 7-like isoform X2 [Phymastichus coffea]|uniref:tudor domain-containing protein 7-like isoform X2 n=1 Tax=Phymastichus coffea TaxID=108790 RepID=UPI00273ADAFC|nr:tudor domain-containing protein 7-like isoform X2 [Phymastichus coffea]XP_058802534.1 tudor domain-containing protein 7-like isoform X2 [Phymastichus coffea]